MNPIECPECGMEVEVPADILQGEILECEECGAELEVIGTNPVTIQLAPEVEEDWGE